MTQSINDLERWEGGFPGAHEFAELGGLDETPERQEFFDAAHDLINKWRGNQFVGLYLYGDAGTGKSFAAIGLARALHDTASAEVHYRFVPNIPNDDRFSKVRRWTSQRSCRDLKQDTYKDSSVFPAEYVNGVERNPKSVLVLDDYKPAWQPEVAAATEAAAQFGGLVIITSNHSDPFKLVEAPAAVPGSTQEVAMESMAASLDPERMEAYRQVRAAKEKEISASLFSRVAAGFKIIKFTGPDRRPENSFWGE